MLGLCQLILPLVSQEMTSGIIVAVVYKLLMISLTEDHVRDIDVLCVIVQWSLQ